MSGSVESWRIFLSKVRTLGTREGVPGPWPAERVEPEPGESVPTSTVGPSRDGGAARARTWPCAVRARRGGRQWRNPWRLTWVPLAAHVPALLLAGNQAIHCLYRSHFGLILCPS